MSENLTFKSLSHGPSKDVIGAAGILVFRTVLKICCKLSSKYLTMKDKVRDIVEGLGLSAELKVEGF